jgi:hypothetical protein
MRFLDEGSEVFGACVSRRNISRSQYDRGSDSIRKIKYSHRGLEVSWDLLDATEDSLKDFRSRHYH